MYNHQSVSRNLWSVVGEYPCYFTPPFMWCSFIHESHCVFRVCTSLINLKGKCRVSPEKSQTSAQPGLRLWHTAALSCTVVLNHQLWTLGAWSDPDQNAQRAFRNRWPLKCDCELYPTRMALPGPSQRKLPKDVMLENSGHLLTCLLWVRLSAFIYLLENHLEEFPQSSLPSTQTHTHSYST